MITGLSPDSALRLCCLLTGLAMTHSDSKFQDPTPLRGAASLPKPSFAADSGFVTPAKRAPNVCGRGDSETHPWGPERPERTVRLIPAASADHQPLKLHQEELLGSAKKEHRDVGGAPRALALKKHCRGTGDGMAGGMEMWQRGEWARAPETL